jgi:hypothetical protein
MEDENCGNEEFDALRIPPEKFRWEYDNKTPSP